MANKELWLHNNTGSDVSLSDLGVKVLANKTINVYKYNPHVTAEQVQKSIESGSLARRLERKTLTVVTGVKNPKPHTLEHLKASTDIVEVVKSKTSVFISTKDEDVIEDGDLGDIADYGLGNLGHENTRSVKKNDGVVVVEQRQDAPKDEKTDAEVKLQVQSSVSGQSIVAMSQQIDSQSNPVGPMTEGLSPEGQPYVVISPPGDPGSDHSIQQIQADAIKQIEKNFVNMNKPKKVGDMVVTDGTTADTDVSDKVTKAASKPYDAQVATKNESGAIVMKLKEVTEDTEEVVSEKAKPTKISKKRKKASKKKDQQEKN